MEIKKFLTVAIVASVVALIFGAILPVFADTSASEDTLTNKGFMDAKYLNENTESVITWEYTNPTILNIDGTEVNISEIPSTYSAITITFSNDWFIRAVKDTGLILYKTGTSSASAIEGATVTSEKNFSMEISSGIANIIIGENTYNYAISGDGLIVTTDNDAPYTIKKSTDIAYLNGDSVVYGVGRTDRALNVSGSSFNAIFKATVDDGVTPISYSPQWTVTDSSVTYTENSNYKDLYNMTAFNVSLMATENSGTVTYNQIFVPSEVTAERSVHMDGTLSALFNLLPLLIGFGLVIGVAGIVISRRM